MDQDGFANARLADDDVVSADSEEAADGDELLIEEISIDGMCGVY